MMVNPRPKLPWIRVRYPVTFLNRMFIRSLQSIIPKKQPLWRKFKPKWELAVEEEEY